MEATFVIVGGGIAGVTCAETLAFLEPNTSIILVSNSALIKTVTNLYAITKTISHFDVEEKVSNTLHEKYENINIIHDSLTEIDDNEFYITLQSGKIIKYKYLCICSGAAPKLIPQAKLYPQLILGIRDTDSVETFIEKLKNAKRIIITGNGGIASELVYKIKNTEIHWVIKNKHISATFMDPGAGEFLLSSLDNKSQEETITKRLQYQEEVSNKSGAALGPDWYKNLFISGANQGNNSKQLEIHYDTEIESVVHVNREEFPLEVTLTNQHKICCDLIVSATGVTARSNIPTKNPFNLSEDGGIQVNEFMQTNLKNIYAAGDICNANWKLAKHWFQMKLWTQARQMGCYAAKCMAGNLNNEEILQDFCFEIFTHSTKLFGFKVILLGLFNGQKLGTNYEMLIRMTKGNEYVKFVMENHKLQGAVLIGDTDLEEMCENLILNQIDLEPYGVDILNPNIDIEDYFD